MIIVIGGPTASGKSDITNKIASHYNAEIINGDAFQVYDGMNIGTAKPSQSELETGRYHLYSYVKPNILYNVKEYQEDCRTLIEKFIQQNKNIIIVGGTGLYIRAALYDYIFQEKNNVSLKNYDSFTNEELYEELTRIDPNEAHKYHFNNRKRIMRALEIYYQNGIKKSDIISQQSHKIIFPNVKIFAIDMPRDILYERINDRVDKMFQLGLVDEVNGLLKKYDSNCRAFQAIGYKEVISYLKKEITLDECKELVKKNTRNYAKRQITFFKHQFPTIWINNKENEIYEYLR